MKKPSKKLCKGCLIEESDGWKRGTHFACSCCPRLGKAVV